MLLNKKETTWILKVMEVRRQMMSTKRRHPRGHRRGEGKDEARLPLWPARTGSSSRIWIGERGRRHTTMVVSFNPCIRTNTSNKTNLGTSCGGSITIQTCSSNNKLVWWMMATYFTWSLGGLRFWTLSFYKLQFTIQNVNMKIYKYSQGSYCADHIYNTFSY